MTKLSTHELVELLRRKERLSPGKLHTPVSFRPARYVGFHAPGDRTVDWADASGTSMIEERVHALVWDQVWVAVENYGRVP